jgi:hypothetical protein
MKITMKEVSRNGNNLLGQLYFDDVIVARDVQCTPKEWEELRNLLASGYDALYTEIELEVQRP